MWITWRASLLQLPGWGSPPRPSHSTPWTREGTHNTTAPFAVVEAILDRQAACTASLVSSQVVHWWPLEPSQHLGTPLKTAPGIFRLYHPTLSCHLSTFHFFFLICMILVASLTLGPSDALKEKSAYLLESAFPWQHHSHQASVVGPQHPSFPGGRILASLLFGRKALTQPFENSQNHMVFEDCIQFYAGCLATWLALNPLISCWGLSLISLGWKECISFCQKSPSFPYKVAIGIKQGNTWWGKNDEKRERETIFSGIEN